MILKTSWSEVKRHADSKNLPLQWAEAGGQTYVILADGAFNLHAVLDEGTADYADFVASYKNVPLRRVLSTSAALANPEDNRFRGTATEWTLCAANSATDIDLTPSATEERWVDGGFIIYKDANPGDKVSFKVVHPVFGVVETYVPSWLIPVGTGSQEIAVYPAKIPAGIKLRVTYLNTGATPTYCGINYRLHRKGAGA